MKRKIKSYTAVSYTHLDVYKRQGLAGTVGTDDCDKVPFLERQAHTAKGFFLVRGVREEGLMKMSDLKHRLPPNAS